jgi:hypothetical protein
MHDIFLAFALRQPGNAWFGGLCFANASWCKIKTPSLVTLCFPGAAFISTMCGTVYYRQQSSKAEAALDIVAGLAYRESTKDLFAIMDTVMS